MLTCASSETVIALEGVRPDAKFAASGFETGSEGPKQQ